jgi:hypothetical protein
VLATTSARTLSIVFRSIKNAHTAAADTITVTLSNAVLGSLGSGAQATRHANRLMSRFEIIGFFVTCHLSLSITIDVALFELPHPTSWPTSTSYGVAEQQP